MKKQKGNRKSMKRHDEKWHRRWERRIHEPFKNTTFYNYIPTLTFIVLFFLTKDYYHGWKQLLFSFLDISIFFRIEKTVAFLVDVLVWALGVAVQIVALVFMIKSFVNIGRCRYYKRLSQKQSGNYLGSARAVTFTGPPGCGKTFSGGANFAIAIAAERWQNLKSDYLLQRSLVKHWIASGDVDKLNAFQSLEESYIFYVERESQFIPCLVSSIPLRDTCGRYSYELTDDVQAQLLRVPEYSVLFNDESGDSQGCDTSKSAPKEIREFYRFNRHFGDFILINTEQGDFGNGKYIRVVTDYNIALEGQQWIMPPNFMLKRLGKKKRRYFEKMNKGKYTDKKACYIGEKLYYLEKWSETIGFRAVPYRFGASDGNSVTVYEKGTYIFPAHGLATYDSRAYRGLYRAGEREIELRGWTSLAVENHRKVAEKSDGNAA